MYLSDMQSWNKTSEIVEETIKLMKLISIEIVKLTRLEDGTMLTRKS